MTLRKKLLPTFNNPVAGQTATVNLTLGQKLHTLWMTVADAAGSMSTDIINEIRLLVNGKVQRRMLASELEAINGLNGTIYMGQQEGTPEEAGFVTHLPIFLAEPWRKTNLESAALAWNLTGPNVASASLEVDIKAGVDTPVISGWYEWSPPDGGLGAITKWIRQTLGASGTVQDFSSFTRGDYYHAFHLFAPTGAHVDKVRLTADGVIFQDVINESQNRALLTARGMNPLNSNSGGIFRFDL